MNGNHHATGRHFPSEESLGQPPIDEVFQAQVTAYALGQLEGVEKAAIEAELARSASARKEVVEIREWGDRLREFNRTMVVPPSASLRAAVARQLDHLPSLDLGPRTRVSIAGSADRPNWRRDWRAWAAMAAAACVLVAAVGFFWDRGHRMPEQVGGVELAAGRVAPSPEPIAPSPSNPQPKIPERPTDPSASRTAGNPSQRASEIPPAPARPTLAENSSSSRPSGPSAVESAPPELAPSMESVPAPAKEAAASDSKPPRSEAAPSRPSPVGPKTLAFPLITPAQSPSRGTRHFAAAKPGFLEAYMSTRPPELIAPRPTTKPKKSREGGLPGAKFGDGEASSGPNASELDAGQEPGSTGPAAKSHPSESHLALPPGMRPGKESGSPDSRLSLDLTKAGKKGKRAPPEPTLPNEPLPDLLVENEFVSTAKFPYSAFSLAVDPRAFALVSRYLHAHHLPRSDQVQIEDLVNYFDYDDPQPTAGDLFAVRVEAADCPWAQGHRLVRIAISSRFVSDAEKNPRAGGTDPSPPVATDVRVQVQFNPLWAASYRLIGYDSPPMGENQADGGSLGGVSFAAGQTVVAMYQIVPAQEPSPGQPVRVDVRSSKTQRGPDRDLTAEPSKTLLTVRLRFQPRGEKPRWLEVPWTDPGQAFHAASRDFRFSAAVAAFGMMLRGSPHRGNITLDEIERIAESSQGNHSQRVEFLELIRLARQLGLGRQG